MSKQKKEETFTILEVANMLDVTTQAVYKRLQQDSDEMDVHLSTKGGKKSLTEAGVKALANLMGIEDPFVAKEDDSKLPAVTEEAMVATEAGKELLSYLRQENERLRSELDEVKRDLKYTQELREQDRRASEEERNEAAEARKRADIMIMQAMKQKEEKPKLLDRLFRRNRKDEEKLEAENG